MNKIERNVKDWNQFRLEHSNVEYTRVKWLELMRDKKLLYYSKMYIILKESNIIEEVGRELSKGGSNVPTFMFNDTPIHRSLLDKIADFYREREDSIVNGSPKPNRCFDYGMLQTNNDQKSDIQLAEELRNRGYEVTATKTLMVESLIAL